MAQHDYVIDNSTGANVRADINNVLQAIATNNSGSSDPSTTVASQFFADTNAGIMKLRNTENNGYVNLFTLAGGIDVDAASNFNEDVTFTGATSGRNIVFDKSNNALEFDDNVKAIFGNGEDLEIYHDSGQSYVQNSTGNFRIDADALRLRSKTGSEALISANVNGAVELYFDNSKKFETYSNGVRAANNGHIKLASDSGKFFMGAGDDAELFYDGTNLTLNGDGTNDTLLRAKSGENSIKLIPDGAVELYHNNGKKFETTSLGATLTGRLTSDGLDVGDSESLRLGNSFDMEIFHDGSDSFIKDTGTGALKICSNLFRANNAANDEAMIKAEENGAVELYFDSSKKFNTESTGVQVFGNLRIDDNNQFQCGNAQDLQIFHDGSNSFIDDTGTGNLVIRSSTIAFENAPGGGESLAKFIGNGAVELYHDNSKKFETTADGIDVSGAAILHSVGVSNALDIEQQSDANYTGIRIRNFFTGSAKNMLVFLDNNGNVRGSIVINNTVTTYNTTSDYRIKENVVNLTDGITRLKKLKPYKFNFVGDSSNTVDGFFAHEASTVVPEAVTGTKDAVVTQAMIDAGEYTSDKLNQEIHQGIDQSKLVPLLVAAVQELITKVETLEAA